MKRYWLIAMTVAGVLRAGEPEAFRPPHAYDAQRYEVGWNRNPFTLQTAPGAVTTDSFARDLAVATYFGDAADPTVVVVNTKTHERISLQKSQPAAHGWRLGAVNLGASRKDITVEILHGRERALLRFDTPYVNALATAAAAASGTGQSAPKGGKLLTIPLPGSGPVTRPPDARQTSPATTPAPAASILLPPLSDAVAAGALHSRLIPLPTLPAAARPSRATTPPSS